MRVQHGDYDHERYLPNNRGKPVGSGLSVWLQDERETHWPGLVAQSYQMVAQAHIPSQGRYSWLLAQLKMLPDTEAAQLITDYEEREQAEARQRAHRDRLRQLAGLDLHRFLEDAHLWN